MDQPESIWIDLLWIDYRLWITENSEIVKIGNEPLQLIPKS